MHAACHAGHGCLSCLSCLCYVLHATWYVRRRLLAGLPAVQPAGHRRAPLPAIRQWIVMTRLESVSGGTGDGVVCPGIRVEVRGRGGERGRGDGEESGVWPTWARGSVQVGSSIEQQPGSKSMHAAGIESTTTVEKRAHMAGRGRRAGPAICAFGLCLFPHFSSSRVRWHWEHPARARACACLRLRLRTDDHRLAASAGRRQGVPGPRQAQGQKQGLGPMQLASGPTAPGPLGRRAPADYAKGNSARLDLLMRTRAPVRACGQPQGPPPPAGARAQDPGPAQGTQGERTVHNNHSTSIPACLQPAAASPGTLHCTLLCFIASATTHSALSRPFLYNPATPSSSSRPSQSLARLIPRPSCFALLFV